MKKFIKHNLVIGLALLVVSFVSCNTADQDAESIVEVNDSYPVASFTTDFTGNVASEGDTIEYHVSINKPISVDLTFTATVVGGDADASDIEAISGTIAAYETETNVSVVLTQDWAADDAETAEIEFGIASLGMKYLVHPSTVNPVLNLTVANYVPDVLTISCDWEKDIEISSNEPYHEDYTYIEHASSNMDFDLFVFDQDDNKVASAETGACPEVISVSGADMPNGTYYVVSFLWASDFTHWDTDGDASTVETETVNHTDVPFTTTFSEQGVFNEISVNQGGVITNTADPDYDNDGVVDFRTVAIFTVTDGIVSVLDAGGTGVGGGKSFPTNLNHRK
ncbi:MAG: hypothetical protein JEY96_08755 [Bacteroidales bacterium]|nr:hypothetical protein [Bacteroidales bacterium]